MFTVLFWNHTIKKKTKEKNPSYKILVWPDSLLPDLHVNNHHDTKQEASANLSTTARGFLVGWSITDDASSIPSVSDTLVVAGIVPVKEQGGAHPSAAHREKELQGNMARYVNKQCQWV